MTKTTLSFLTFVLFVLHSYSAAVSGLITDEKGEGLPFASVYVEGSSVGTTSNAQGYYKLAVPEGSCRVVFRMIGYKQEVREVKVKDEVTLNVQLFPESYQLKEVRISADAEDPAYDIIRKAQKKRKFYKEQVKEFTSDAYTKFLQKLDSYPKKILGEEVDVSEELDTNTRIIYLSEAVSKLSFRYPDKVKEEMISSKVSGSNRAFSFNQAAGLLFDFYENLIDLGGISPRGFVSPIAANAFLFYDYRFEGSFVENGVSVNKIKVIPKRKHDPVFDGYIFIQDDTWRIHSADLTITKASQIEFVDSLIFHQVYVPVNNEVWMPFSAKVDFVFGFLGFKGRGYFLSISSNYNIDPQFPKGYFNGEVLKINKDANKKDSSYWQQSRQVPLTLEEDGDYIKRDSLSLIRESKPYRDSVDRINNKFKPLNLILDGYSYNKSYSKQYFSVSPFISNIQFNTVEGLSLKMNVDYMKGDEEGTGKSYRLEGNIRYGFSNGHLNGYVGYRRRYNPLKMARYTVDVGTDVVQFNPQNPVSELINSGYTLFGEQNYMKVYERRFVKGSHTSELINGLRLAVDVEWSQRVPLVNSTSYTWVDKEGRDYTSNNPLSPLSDTAHFVKHEAFIIGLKFIITPGQRYMTRPDGKYLAGTDWPVFMINYQKAFDQFLGSDLSFDKISMSISRNFDIGLLGSSRIEVRGGDFLSSKRTEFMDYQHFNGNQTIFSDFRSDGFGLLDYYTYSTTRPYFAGKLDHDFGGFILNKIPLIRRLKLTEVVGVHYLHTDSLNAYTELSFGLEKLGAFRIDFVTSLDGTKNAGVGFVLGIKGLQ